MKIESCGVLWRTSGRPRSSLAIVQHAVVPHQGLWESAQEEVLGDFTLLQVSLESLIRKVVRMLKIHAELLIKPDIPFVVNIIGNLVTSQFPFAWTRADEETVLAGAWFVDSLANRYDKGIYQLLKSDVYRRIAFACNALNPGSESVGDVDPISCYYRMH